MSNKTLCDILHVQLYNLIGRAITIFIYVQSKLMQDLAIMDDPLDSILMGKSYA